MNQKQEIATLAGGYFWCTEAIFKRLQGVTAVTPGYTGGTTANPTYDQVCSGKTGHAEAIQISFHPAEIPFQTLLDIFFALHDPTTVNRQGHDMGTQYRSVIFFHSQEQKKTALDTIERLNKSTYQGKIVTAVVPAQTFYSAEEYHQDYFSKNSYQPYCQIVIDPKIRKLLQQFQSEIKKEYRAY